MSVINIGHFDKMNRYSSVNIISVTSQPDAILPIYVVDILNNV